MQVLGIGNHLGTERLDRLRYWALDLATKPEASARTELKARGTLVCIGNGRSLVPRFPGGDKGPPDRMLVVRETHDSGP